MGVGMEAAGGCPDNLEAQIFSNVLERRETRGHINTRLSEHNLAQIGKLI